jgi:methyl-accepting chemotaxis protein
MHWFTNLKTRSKLSLGFGIVSGLLLLVVVTGWLSLRAVRDAEAAIADVMRTRANFNAQRADMLAALLLSAPEAEAQFTSVAEYSQENDEALRRISTCYRGDVELRGYAERISAIRADQVQTRDREVVPLLREGKKDEARALILGVQTERLERFRELAEEFTGKLRKRSEQRLRQTQLIFGLLGSLALATAIGMILGLTRLLAHPLEQTSAVAELIVNGDLDFEFADVNRTDEVGVLMQTFQKMRRSLTVLSGRARQIAEGDLTAQIRPRSERDVLGNAFASMLVELRRVMNELQEAVNVLASSSSEIMVSTKELAATAAETAAAVTETTATVEEVKQTSQVSTEKARAVADEARRAVEVARTGRATVEATIEGMTGLRTQMAVVAESILSLSAQGQAIAEIIATVDDLAAQSKLLAVNASIEAAKAGEEGKGFAVVAQEVRNLAEQSKQATLQVRGILSEIQKATGRAVLATEEGSKQVEAGVKQATASGESISALAANIATAAQAATQIAATSQQQFVGMDQVAMAMENVRAASTQTAASTRQAETAAQQLHDLGQKLKRLVERFKV